MGPEDVGAVGGPRFTPTISYKQTAARAAFSLMPGHPAVTGGGPGRRRMGGDDIQEGVLWGMKDPIGIMDLPETES